MVNKSDKDLLEEFIVNRENRVSTFDIAFSWIIWIEDLGQTRELPVNR